MELKKKKIVGAEPFLSYCPSYIVKFFFFVLQYTVVYCNRQCWLGRRSRGRWARSWALGERGERGRARQVAGRWRAGHGRAGTGHSERTTAGVRGARGLGAGRTAWALGARPGCAGWPGLCTWCTRPVFDPV